MPVVVRRPAPPLDGLITAITYRAGEQPCTSVERLGRESSYLSRAAASSVRNRS